MMKPQSPFTKFLLEDKINVEEFSTLLDDFVPKEPTLFYLLSKQMPKIAVGTQDSKFKSTIAFTIAVILEYSHVSRIPTILEKEG